MVTIPAGRQTPWIDVQTLACQVAGLATVHQVPTGRLTFRLNDAIGRRQGVYGGAGRVYDSDLSWRENDRRCPLRLVYHETQGARATDLLIGDVLRMSAARPPTAPRTDLVAASGVVIAIVPPTRAVVRLDDGREASVRAETVPGEVPIDGLVRPGQRVTGVLDPRTGHLDVSGSVVSHLFPSAPVGAVILTRVSSMADDALTLTPAPGIDVRLSLDDVTDDRLDRLDDLVSLGEVLPARVLAGPPAGEWRLTLRGLDPDEPPTVVPPAILPGGPPWLTLDHPRPDADDPGELVADVPAETSADDPLVGAPAPTLRPVDQSRVDDLTTEISGLREALRSQQSEIARLRAANEHLRTTNRRSRAKRSGSTTPERQVHGFADAEEQLRWEVLKTWVEQTLPADKIDHPLPEQWLVGPRFVSSLDLEGISRERVLGVVVQVLTGRQPKSTHPLRRGVGGDDPQLRRPDGATAWRAPLQQNAPAARRLHYWRLPDGRIELSRVVPHDAMKP